MAEDYSYSAEDYLLLGKIAKAQGLRGEVKIFSYSGQPENIGDYKELVLVDRSGKLSAALTIEKSRARGKTAIVQFAAIKSRGMAEDVVGLGVLLAKKHLPAAGEDEYYWHQFEGKRVEDQTGKTIGRVESLFNNGAQDILVVKAGREEILIPVIREIVIGETDETLIINPPPGLLELDE